MATVALGCSESAPTKSDSDLAQPTRLLIGAGVRYEADLGLTAREDELKASQKTRRAEAWKAFGRVLRDVGR